MNKNLNLNKNKILFLIFFCSIFITNHAMEIQSLPDDMLLSIFKFSCPMDLRCEKEATTLEENETNITYTKIHLPKLATRVINLRRTNTKFNNIITKNISALLDLNKSNINAFLIRSTQANIPYFMNIAIKHEANPNIIYAPDGYTPLLYATAANNYSACKFLLENKANINLPRQMPTIEKYFYNLVYDTDNVINPIYTAVHNDNTELLTLFIKKDANFSINEVFPMYYQVFPMYKERNWATAYSSLLQLAALKLNPDILTILLYNEYKGIKCWALPSKRDNSEIDCALNNTKGEYSDPIIEAPYARRRKLCHDLLYQAKKAADVINRYET